MWTGSCLQQSYFRVPETVSLSFAHMNSSMVSALVLYVCFCTAWLMALPAASSKASAMAYLACLKSCTSSSCHCWWSGGYCTWWATTVTNRWNAGVKISSRRCVSCAAAVLQVSLMACTSLPLLLFLFPLPLFLPLLWLAPASLITHLSSSRVHVSSRVK